MRQNNTEREGEADMTSLSSRKAVKVLFALE